MKVAIVGGGISGSTILRKLIESGIEDLSIDIYELRDKLVVGFPYDDDSPSAIMNEHAIDLSIYRENPDDFYNWLKEHSANWADPDAFVPRNIYGDYLHDRLIAYYDYDQVNIIRQEVVDMESKDGTYRLQTADAAWLGNYDAVFYALGHPPYADHYQLEGLDNYIHNPYPIHEKLQQIQAGPRIAIIGSGLTALDILNYLMKNSSFEEPVQVFIPEEPFNTVKFTRYRGNLQLTFSSSWLQDQLTLNNGRVSLDVIVEQFMADLKANNIDIVRLYQEYGTGSLEEISKAIEAEEEELIKLRLYIVKLTAFLPDLYNALTPSDRDVYHKKYEKIFNHFRSQMPGSSLSAVLNWVTEGRLEFVSAIEQVEPEGNAFKLTADGQTYQSDLIINAAGFDFDLSRSKNLSPLVQNLYNKEIFTPYYRKGIMVTWPNCQVVTANQGILPNVYLLGHWISGIHYGNNNIHLCIKQAERIAQTFIEENS